MMTSTEIRQSFLDFFRAKEHSIVLSSSLLPDSPNLLFTNAGMNQFVPIFLGEKPADVSRWAGAIPGRDSRAADTQKCIRAGGKHNDLEDVGLDTYHHTFFEMLGNWSFGDYFKTEAIEWAWELVVEHWKFPPQRLYATVYQPGDGDPAERDTEAHACWTRLFERAGLNPAIHVVDGDKKDNFWMMGDTGPCGPCSELHVDLTPEGDTAGALVNAGDPRCIEIWNLVFIQFNANPDGSFTPLPARHVDTGMGFERVTSILQGTQGFTNFANAKISNYETDIFRPIFDELERMSGKRYGSTLPAPGSAGEGEQEQIDMAFRVIADHIRTLSFAIADGIQPGNSDRNYVLRRILRRAVRYGRSLGFKDPFFYKLAEVLARTMGGVFPEIRKNLARVEEVLRREEEAFNRTLDKGIALFGAEAVRLLGGNAGRMPADATKMVALPGLGSGARYWKRRLPHYERPHGIYHITFSTKDRRTLSPDARQIVLDALVHFDHERYDLFVACVMPDHIHVLFQPLPKGNDAEGNPIFWSLADLLHSVKSFSATKINKAEDKQGQQLWENEYHDRLMRSDAEVEEKFQYICKNPWTDNVVGPQENYPWLWTWNDGNGERGLPARISRHPAGASETVRQDAGASESVRQDAGASETVRQDAGQSGLEARAPQSPSSQASCVISGAFAFRLYDEQGFPLDLTQLMARERGLSVDVSGFEIEMEKQRARARAAQKKTVIELSEIETKTATHFIGYDHDHTGADVQEVLSVKGKTVVIANNSVCYAEMGGQVGDIGEMCEGDRLWQIADTRKAGDVWLHFLQESDAPAVGDHVAVRFDRTRRAAIQRHHTATHLLHWALHEVMGRDANQKGSFVGPDKLTFDFNSAALTPVQVRDIERLVNERILENAAVTWAERPYAEIRDHPDVLQFFGDKYGDTVRVVQIGGNPDALDGFSMELCGGTHTRATGEIGLFRIVSEAAIAAGVRRIEAVAGMSSFELARAEHARLKVLADTLGAPIAEVEKKLELLVARQKELEKSLKAARQREAATRAKELAATAGETNGVPLITARLDEADGDALQDILDALKGRFQGVVFLVATHGGAVALAVSVSPEFTKIIQAGKLLQAVAPIVGGKGGGRPDNARGAGKDPEKIAEALKRAEALIRENTGG